MMGGGTAEEGGGGSMQRQVEGQVLQEVQVEFLNQRATGAKGTEKEKWFQ